MERHELGFDDAADAAGKPCSQPNPVAPNGMHPDHHAVVVSQSNPGLFFDGSDGGLMRSDGEYKDISSQCTNVRGLTGDDLALCQQLLSQVPKHPYSLNKGLSTLQFQSLSVAADNAQHLQGGTQDNGTFEATGAATLWPQIIYGDGGQSGFNVGDSTQRFNTFFANYTDAIPERRSEQVGRYLRPAVRSRPRHSTSRCRGSFVAGTIFVGEQSVWRTQDWGGSQAYLETNCPEFTTSGSDPLCGDFVKIGNGVPSTELTSALGARSLPRHCCGGCPEFNRFQDNVAATSTGRVFFSNNADARQPQSSGSASTPRQPSIRPVCERYHDRSSESKSRLDCIFKL